VTVTASAPTATDELLAHDHWSRERVRSGMKVALEAAGAIPPPIVVEPVVEIEREPGSMKAKVVKTVREAAA
jgi:hypothetical protein